MLKPLHKYLQLFLHTNINCIITIVIGMDFYMKLNLKWINKITGTNQEQGKLLLQIRNHSLWGIREAGALCRLDQPYLV